MILSNTGQSEGSEFDPIKDAQDTADDSAILKRFKILNLIGTGNYARVYKAVAQSGRELAIKSINLSRTSDNYKQKFLPRELNILKKINHFNICKIHEIIQVADRVFIVMQYCSRGTIADLLHRLGPLSEPVSRFLFSQTADAVNYMHSIELAHRDLKLENILLDTDYSPKITDFSYSVHLVDKQAQQAPIGADSRNTNSSSKYKNLNNKPRSAPTNSMSRLTDTFCGTLPYLSPEMVRQQAYNPKRTDLWSLGVCLYVMLNDRVPFPFNDMKVLLRKQLLKDYKFKTSIEFSDQVKDLVNLMLEPDPNKRISSLEVTKHVWLTNGPKEKPS